MIRNGYILSRHAVTVGDDTWVELWVKTDSGPVCLRSEAQTPLCFVETTSLNALLNVTDKNGISVTHFDNQFKTLTQTPVTTIKTKTELAMHELRQCAQQSSITLYEADVRLVDRYLMERFIYGSLAFYSPSAADTFIDKAKIKASAYTPTLDTLSIDIECDENETLYSIGLASSSHNEVILLKTPCHSSVALDIRHHSAGYTLTIVDSETELLTLFCQRVRDIDPDILLGWNVKQFDLAVLGRRAKKNNITLLLGRANSVMKVREWDGQTYIDLPGRCVVDGIEALKTMTYQFENFALDTVANVLLNKRKLILANDKLAEIKALYLNDPIALATYNHQDCTLVNEIEEKTKFIDFLVLRGALTGLAIERPGGSVAAFINVYLPKLHRQRYISGNRPQDGGLASPGGYVMTSKPGLYNDVLVLDFKSLYPSIIRTFKIDPLGLAEGLENPTTAIEGFKGARFSREKHFLPSIIENLWSQRDEAKRVKDSARSQAIKILMNSFYGVLGSGGCPFYDTRLASSITLRGHEIMQTTATWIREKGYQVIYGDTDSTFVHINGNDSLGTPEQTGQHLAAMINEKWRTYLNDTYQIDCFLEIEFETHFDTFFMPTIRGSALGSKKRYAGMVNKDGQQTLIFKGLENVRSDWTTLAKRFQHELYVKVFNKSPIAAFIKDIVDVVKSGKEDKNLVYKKRLRKPLAAYTKTRPPHVKAALHAEEVAGTSIYANRNVIYYVMTTNGPQTLDYQSSPLDYNHYIDKQLRPIADSILPLINESFDNITNEQLTLFN
ncbi:DNA polymerase II [Alteromonas sp.]|nr:DNA polymerase II [Alteromonas sp.]